MSDRQAAEAALIEAAADLWAAQGDASVRAIADRAGVNHGLVHHYFGGKPGLRRAVLAHLAQALDDNLDVPERADLRTLARAASRVTQADPRHLRILARALLDDEPPAGLQDTFPVVQRLMDAVPEAQRAQAQAILGPGLALALGSFVFGPWIARAVGLEPAALQALIDALTQDYLDRLEAPE